MIIDDANINKFDNSGVLNESQSILYNFDWFYFGFDEYKLNDQYLLWDELYKLWKEENLCNIWKSEFNYFAYNNDNWEELRNQYFIDLCINHYLNWNIEQFDKLKRPKYIFNEDIYQNCEACLDCLWNSHYNSNISWGFLGDINFQKYSINKLCSWNNIYDERQIDIIYEENQCFTIFDHSKFELSKSNNNDHDENLNNRVEVISFKFKFYLYVILFNLCCLEIICNQISHVENSASLKDSRLCNIAYIVLDICHTLYVAIPFLWFQYDYKEADIWENTSPIKIENNKYIFSFIFIYIALFFTVICLQRLLLLKREELKAWYNFLKLLFSIILMHFIWGNVLLAIVLKFGIPNWLLAANIILNIISKKTVTEDWLTASIKLLLYNMSPINSINNFKYQYTGFEDFVKSLYNVGHHQILIVSENQSTEKRVQNIVIQIVLVSILFLQKKYGSLFFLPSWLRSKKFDKMKKDKRKLDKEHIKKILTFLS